MIANAQVLNDRPQAAVAMVQISSSWATIEHEMLVLLGCATGEIVEYPKSGRTTVHMNQVARIAMNVTISLGTRLQLLNDSLSEILDSEFKDRWKAIERDIRARSKERNRIVHAIVYAPTGQGVREGSIVLESPTFPQPNLYTLADLQAILSRLQMSLSRLEEFNRDVVHAQGDGRLASGRDRLLPDYWDFDHG